MEDKPTHTNSPDTPSTRSAKALRDLQDRAHSTISSQRDSIRRLETKLTTQLEAIDEALTEQFASHADESEQAQHQASEVEALRQDLEASQDAWREEQQKLKNSLQERQQQLDQRDQELEQRDTELHELRETWERQQSAWQNEREKLTDKQEALATALKLAGEQLEAARHEAEDRTDLDALNRKFELALADVQRFRSQVTQLEQELASRPKEDQGDTAELVHLRAERDALVERVTDLENQPTSQPDADTEQHIADLQRRFELAVEDVRELKTEKAELETQLAQAEDRVSQQGSGTAPLSDNGAMDWESQKRRLMASLDEEDGERDTERDAERQKERLAIKDTLSITDDVVAQKDHQIAELQEQLLQRDHEPEQPTSGSLDAAMMEQLDADEVIQQHREQIQRLEKEMEEKLRAAEMEISVQRAKIAREQAELAEWRIELETDRDSIATKTKASPVDQPKRRWLDKLGLGGEEG